VKVFSVKVFMVFALCVSVVFAAGTPGLAATNPFMDVPLNHWAYDAIGHLAAQGILSGYPDGTYKGKQPTTRYEMASALARALAAVDVTKARKQDVEMLKRLVIEFKDELDALGVKVDQLDKRVSVVENRLGGWKIGGELRLDIEDWDSEDADGSATLSLARIEFQRWFGEDESIFFYARLEEGDSGVAFDKFYAEFPFFMDTTVTVGRFDRDFEGDYRFQIGGTTDIANDAWLTDRTVDGFALARSFGLGSFNFYVARPGDLPTLDPDEGLSMWEFAGLAQLQFSEQFGFDLGFQAFLGDEASTLTDDATSIEVDNIWTVFAGARFSFTPNIAFKGLYYYQGSSAEEDSTGVWRDADLDNTSAWKAIIDVKQEAIGFANLWLEYDHLEAGFYLPYNNTALTLTDDAWHSNGDAGIGFVDTDTDIWRVGATRQWNDKWSSWLYAAGHTLENGGLNAAGAPRDAKALQWGLGVEYQYNENVAFALGYIEVDWNGEAENAGFADDHLIRFRTGITF
jgi:opacity protein-like surface antigen